MKDFMHSMGYYAGIFFAMLTVLFLLKAITEHTTWPELVSREHDYTIKVTHDSGDERIRFSGGYMIVDGSGSNSHSVEGWSNESYSAKGDIRIVSAVFQKKTRGTLTVRILRDGVSVGESSTSAEYGVVTVAAQ